MNDDKPTAASQHLQHCRTDPHRPDDIVWRRTRRSTRLPEEVPGERWLPPILGSLWTAILIGSVLGLCWPLHYVVDTTDPDDLQDPVDARVRATQANRRAQRRGSVGHFFDVPRDRSELRVDHSEAAGVW